MVVKIQDRLISIIIVNFNGKRWLSDCINSINNQTFKNLEVLIVDNGSSDGSVDFVKSKYPTIKVIELRRNLGFGSANNIGVVETAGSILFFLNNDTKILQKNFFNKILNEKRKKKLNICGPRIFNFDNEEITKGFFQGADILGYPTKGKHPFYVDGCALMINRNDFDTLGGFDEKYFMYSEDIDLSWRARLYGMNIGICESAKLLHYGGGSSLKTLPGKKQRHIVSINRRYEVEKNILRTILKNYSIINLVWSLQLYMVLLLIESILYLLLLKPKLIPKLFASVWWNIKNIKDTLKERDVVQTRRVVNDLTVMKKMSWHISKIALFFRIGVPKIS